MSRGKFADHFPYSALMAPKSIFLKAMHNFPNSLLQSK